MVVVKQWFYLANSLVGLEYGQILGSTLIWDETVVILMLAVVQAIGRGY